VTAAFPAKETQRRQPRGFVQPAFQYGARPQTGGFAGENDENRLCDFLGLRGNPDMRKATE
jgi:hypothetical protein